MRRRRSLVLVIGLIVQTVGVIVATLWRDTFFDRVGAATTSGTVFIWAAAVVAAVLLVLYVAVDASMSAIALVGGALVFTGFARTITDSHAWLAFAVALLVLQWFVAFQRSNPDGRRRVLLGVTVIVVLGAFVATLISPARPGLGLDLKGGISVRLFPEKGTDSSLLPTARQIIENRVNGLGVAEPEVSVQGATIVVDLPGVKDRAKALAIVGTTAELQNREVLQGPLPAGVPLQPATPSTTVPGATTTTKPGATTTTKPGATTTTKPPTVNPGTSSTTAARGSGAGRTRTIATAPVVARADVTTTATTKPGVTTTTKPGVTTTTKPGATPAITCETLTANPPPPNQGGYFLDQPVKGRQPTACYQLGPNLLPGTSVTGAAAGYDPQQGGWGVDVTYRGDSFVKAVAEPYVGKRVAIVLDNRVLSAPTINAGITGSQVRISGSFTQGSAKQLALALKYGSLPVRFDEKQQTVENVSPSLGRDQLRAGIAAGIIGLALVALYMLFFYRLLGIVVWVGLVLTAMIMFTIVTLLGQGQGLTLTLSGITGIIVSVGVTVDSYVVYFERLKDEVRTGKTVRSSVDTGWKRAWRTIVAADAVALIGAGVLYALTIGSVKGFAYFLALSTFVDLILAWCYMHPLVSLMARRRGLVDARGIGIASGLDVAGAPA